MPAVMWFRRDLRVRDHPAITAAADAARRDGDGAVTALFVVDPVLWSGAGAVRQSYLVASLRELDASIGGRLLIATGDPAQVVARVAERTKARSVHVSEDFAPYGRRRDARVRAALRAPLVATGSPYAVSPGRVTKQDGTPYRVFTPFHRAWLAHGWRQPAADVGVEWADPLRSEELPTPAALPQGLALPPAGEAAAWQRWERFRQSGLARYPADCDVPALDGTSALSHHLRWGELHPRSLLADLDQSDEAFRRELCWREFYADVLLHQPRSARQSLNPGFDALPWVAGDQAEHDFALWAAGRTGYPFVDAGMRQLQREGWMHNRLRMVTASFLVKDLHLPWQRGAAHFLEHLRDGDLASNAHGWQWTAGCGTDAAPFHRIFNPVTQGLRLDPSGDYVRRFVPELGHLQGAQAHQPWLAADGHDQGYPERMVDHAHERAVALSLRRPGR